MKLFKILGMAGVSLSLALAATSCGGGSGDSDMDAFVDELMSKMTLEEKLGQLNLPASDDIVTGQAKSSNIGTMVAEGKVGGVFNINPVLLLPPVKACKATSSRP